MSLSYGRIFRDRGDAEAFHADLEMRFIGQRSQ